MGRTVIQKPVAEVETSSRMKRPAVCGPVLASAGDCLLAHVRRESRLAKGNPGKGNWKKEQHSLR